MYSTASDNIHNWSVYNYQCTEMKYIESSWACIWLNIYNPGQRSWYTWPILTISPFPPPPYNVKSVHAQSVPLEATYRMGGGGEGGGGEVWEKEPLSSSSNKGQRWNIANFHILLTRIVAHITWLNPFTPESDQCQNSPAASQEIWHHTVRRTWLFIAYSDERWF